MVGIGDPSGVGSVVSGLAWDAGSGIVKNNLGGSAGHDEGEWPLVVGGLFSIARYSADARGERGGHKQGPSQTRGLLPLQSRAHGLEGWGGRACYVLDASLQEDDGGGCGPQVFPCLLNLV